MTTNKKKATNFLCVLDRALTSRFRASLSALRSQLADPLLLSLPIQHHCQR